MHPLTQTEPDAGWLMVRPRTLVCMHVIIDVWQQQQNGNAKRSHTIDDDRN